MNLINATGKIITDKKEISRCLDRWSPLNPYMLVDASTNGLKSVMSINCYADAVMHGLKRRLKMVLLLEAVTIILLASIWLYSGSVRALNSSVALIFVWLFTVIDFNVVILERENLKERSNFVFCLKQRFFQKNFSCIIFMISCGAFQIYLQRMLGGFEATMLHLGVVNDKVLNGQWWRLLSGPILHTSLLHWLGNFTFLLMVGSVAASLSRRNAVVVFFVGMVVGAASFVFFAPKGYDSFAGVSGGIYSLFGWCAGCSFMKPAVLPGKFFVTSASFTLMSIGVSYFLNADSSTIAHVAGFCFGMCYGLMTSWFVFPKSFMKSSFS